MSRVVSQIERAAQDERLRQTRAVFFANSGAFNDGLIARAAISALRDASPEILGPLADLIVQAQFDERAARTRGDAVSTSSVDRHATMIVDTWNAIIDAALASLDPMEPGQGDAGPTKPVKANGATRPTPSARGAIPKGSAPPIGTGGA